MLAPGITYDESYKRCPGSLSLPLYRSALQLLHEPIDMVVVSRG